MGRKRKLSSHVEKSPPHNTRASSSENGRLYLEVQRNDAPTAVAFYTVTSKRGPQQCVGQILVSSSCGTLQRSPTKDMEFWLLNSPPSAVSFKVRLYGLLSPLLFVYGLSFFFFALLSTAGTQYHWSTERGNVPLYKDGPSERPTQRKERTNGRRRSLAVDMQRLYVAAEAKAQQLTGRLNRCSSRPLATPPLQPHVEGEREERQ